MPAVAKMSVLPQFSKGVPRMTKAISLAMFCVAMMAAGSARADGFLVESAQVSGGAFKSAQVSDRFGCNGRNVSPAIRWSGAPQGTQSYLLTLFDADAPTGSGFWQWVVADIPASAHGIASGAGNDASRLPPGALAIRNDTGKPGYLGPCPPRGESHRYVVTLTALKVARLPVDSSATPAMVGFAAHSQEIARATLVVRYAR
jgi:Raf kinase inhibitor-like YbhB/YbcL family protein